MPTVIGRISSGTDVLLSRGRRTVAEIGAPADCTPEIEDAAAGSP
jgi:hypothetical protein